MSDESKTLLETLVEKRNALADEAASILDTVESEDRDISVEEEARAAELQTEMRSLTQEIELRETIERSRLAAEKAATKVEVVSEPAVYRADTAHTTSYFRDLAVRKGLVSGDTTGAIERLQRHAAQVNETRADSQAYGSGGEFIPPTWLTDAYIPALRYGSPFANSLTQMPLPSGTNVINIPKVSRGSLTGLQSADNSALANQDIQTTSVQSTVKTLGGYMDISVQAVELSPGQILDKVIFADLVADYALQKDLFALEGVLGTSGVNAVTYTDASPSASKLFPVLAQGISQIAKNRKGVSGLDVTTWMTPSTYYWLAAGEDTTGRPLIVPTSSGNYNPQGTTDGTIVSQGPIATLALGSPVKLDGSIPTTGGNNTIVQVISDDVWFMEAEGGPRLDVFDDVLSATASLRFRCFNYVATPIVRHPEAVSVITGSGLAPQAGY